MCKENRQVRDQQAAGSLQQAGCRPTAGCQPPAATFQDRAGGRTTLFGLKKAKPDREDSIVPSAARLSRVVWARSAAFRPRLTTRLAFREHRSHQEHLRWHLRGNEPQRSIELLRLLRPLRLLRHSFGWQLAASRRQRASTDASETPQVQ